MAAVPCCVGFLVGFGSVTPPPSHPSPHPRWVSRAGMEGVCVCVGGLPFAPFSVHGPPLQQLARSAKPHLILLTALGFPRWLGGRMGGGGVPSAAGPGSCTGAEGSASFGAVDSPGVVEVFYCHRLTAKTKDPPYANSHFLISGYFPSFCRELAGSMTKLLGVGTRVGSLRLLPLMGWGVVDPGGPLTSQWGDRLYRYHRHPSHALRRRSSSLTAKDHHQDGSKDLTGWQA